MAKTRVTPNQVTVVRLFSGIAAAAMLARGECPRELRELSGFVWAIGLMGSPVR